jgi:hypothetical protein
MIFCRQQYQADSSRQQLKLTNAQAAAVTTLQKWRIFVRCNCTIAEAY